MQRSWGQEVGTWIQALNLLHAFISLSLVIIRDKKRMDKQGERQNNSCKKFHFIIRPKSGRVCYCLQPYIRHVNHLHLHIWTFYLYIYILVVYIYTFTLTSFCVNVWECVKCIYYIPLMAMPSCKSILIRFGCIPKLNLIFLQSTTLIGPS